MSRSLLAATSAVILSFTGRNPLVLAHERRQRVRRLRQAHNLTLAAAVVLDHLRKSFSRVGQLDSLVEKFRDDIDFELDHEQVHLDETQLRAALKLLATRRLVRAKRRGLRRHVTYHLTELGARDE